MRDTYATRDWLILGGSTVLAKLRSSATAPGSMKRDLSQEELVDGWTLAPNELLLMINKSGPGRLGFAAMLKFFQAEARSFSIKTKSQTRRSAP